MNLQLNIFIKKANTSPKVAAIKDDIAAMIQEYKEKKQKLESLHPQVINTKPEQYKEFLDKLEKYDLDS